MVFLSGCESGGHFTLLGYSTAPPIHEGIRTVYVPIAANTTYLIGIEQILTRAVVQEIGASGYRVTSDRNRADSELVMKVVANRKNTIILNQLAENRQAEIGIQIEVVWRDLRKDHEGNILSNPKGFDPKEKPLPGEPRAQAPQAIPLIVTPTATFTPEVGGSNQSAYQLAVNRAARQIVNMMEVWR
ncbi:MAG: hypothetical protein HYX68_29460 [Planctomycetes bacterium]|nr:hypothetical protein [Planctomycetota bacterium]